MGTRVFKLSCFKVSANKYRLPIPPMVQHKAGRGVPPLYAVQIATGHQRRPAPFPFLAARLALSTLPESGAVGKEAGTRHGMGLAHRACAMRVMGARSAIPGRITAGRAGDATLTRAAPASTSWSSKFKVGRWLRAQSLHAHSFLRTNLMSVRTI